MVGSALALHSGAGWFGGCLPNFSMMGLIRRRAAALLIGYPSTDDIVNYSGRYLYVPKLPS